MAVITSGGCSFPTGGQYLVDRAAWSSLPANQPPRRLPVVPAVDATTGEKVLLLPESLPRTIPEGTEDQVPALALYSNSRLTAGMITAVTGFGGLALGGVSLRSYLDDCTGGRGYDNCNAGLFGTGFLFTVGAGSAIASIALLVTGSRSHPERASPEDMQRRSVATAPPTTSMPLRHPGNDKTPLSDDSE